ncbi:MAG TPA: SDR family oxidoreductase [Bryobacteraceae bacterium]|nr:SDR family oxidoreductase [Bryobacteraceae bacterium]
MADSHEVVLVTGAGSGMGMETALLMAAGGYRVYGSVLNDTEDAALRNEAAARRTAVETVRMDVTDAEQAASAVRQVMGAEGRIDVLIQFVGIGLRGFFEDLEMAEIRRVFDVNLFGLMNVTQAVLPHMRTARRGRILLTSSIGGRMGSMSISGYVSSKFAIEGWAECLRQEVAPFGIWVTLLEPGLIQTPHFTVNRNRARRAMDPSSPYYSWFCQHEKIVDDILANNKFTVAQIAEAVRRIVQARRPRLRYVIGTKAKLILAMHRYIPGEWFQNVYWSMVRRMVTKPREQAQMRASYN